MENKENLNDVKILGSGSISQGEYNNVKVAGSGQILGNIKANDIKVSGSGDFQGNIITKGIKCSGSMSCNGTVKSSDILKVNGSGIFKEDLKGKEIILNGGSSISGNVSFENMISKGSCEINGSCEGEEFNSFGYIRINELLAADKINIVPEGESYIKEIGGEEITIKSEQKKKFMFLKFSFSSDGFISCEIIEGDKITLENTKCKIVRGENITIGRGCEIGKIEYTGELNITDDKSIVGEKVCMKN